MWESGEIPGGLLGWSLFRGTGGGAVMGAGANFMGLTKPVCSVDARGPGWRVGEVL